MTEYGYRQETYRGFIIDSTHEGEDGEVTGYAVTVDRDDFHEERGSMIDGFDTIADARAFIDRELTLTPDQIAAEED